MIKIISKKSSVIGNEPVSPEERLYVSTTLGLSFRSFDGEVLGAIVRFEEQPSGEQRCVIEVETRVASIVTESSASSREIAFAGAAEVLDRRLFSVIYGSSRRAA